MKRWVAGVITAGVGLLCTLGCTAGEAEHENTVYGMVCDVDQIKEDAFSWSAWEGLEEFAKDKRSIEVQYLESREEKDILPNLERLADDGCELIWGIGEAVKEPIVESAGWNSTVDYILMDYAPKEEVKGQNLSYVDFRSEQAAFLAGYAAAYATEAETVGFVGGKKLHAVGKFEAGFTQGVSYAAKEQEKDIQVKTVYVDDFSDKLYGSEAAKALMDEGCDVLFHAAGQSGLGVIEAAAENDCWVIGADVDQYEEAPGVVLLSVIKNTKEAVSSLSERYDKGEQIEGKTFIFGLDDHGVGITENNPNLDKHYPGLYEKTMEVRDKIIDGEIKVLEDAKEETKW